LILIEAPSSAYHRGMLALGQHRQQLKEEETSCDSTPSNPSIIAALTYTLAQCTFAS
jgi:hypothetical protein